MFWAGPRCFRHPLPTAGLSEGRRLRALQDCVLLLQAQKLGLTALTANVVDFDYLLQLIPAGRALLYRRSETP